MSNTTAARQVRLIKCAIMSPGLAERATNDEDKQHLATYGFDILPFVQRIDIYESIFDNTLSGSILLLEDIGLIDYIPIVGVETIVVSFEIDGREPFTHAFRITKAGKQTFPRHYFRLYQLDFASIEFVESLSKRLCRRFTSSASSAVENILHFDLGVKSSFVTLEHTREQLDVVIPNYTPLMAINYFTMLARTADTEESNFLFYETLRGFHFTSVSKLMKDAPKDEDLRVFQVDAGHMSTDTSIEHERAMNALIRVHQDQSFNLLEDIQSGALRSKVIHLDFLARKIEHVDDSRYTKTFKRTTHLDKYPVYPNNFELSVNKNAARQFIIPTDVFTSRSRYVRAADPIVDHHVREAVVLRNRQLRELKHIQTLIDLPGHPDLRAGTIVNVRYPSSRTMEQTQGTINAPVYTEGTPYQSGKHIVASVHHILTTKGNGTMEYRMNLRVCRDSLGRPLIGFEDSNG